MTIRRLLKYTSALSSDCSSLKDFDDLQGPRKKNVLAFIETG